MVFLTSVGTERIPRLNRAQTPFNPVRNRYAPRMGLMAKGLLMAAATAAGAATVNRLLTGRAEKQRRSSGKRRHVLTVFRPMDEITVDGRLPEPLERLGDAVAVDLRPAPGDRGTEIAVRPLTGDVDDRAVRRALRESRSLLEVGYLLHPDAPATTEPTPLNRPLRAATAHGREGGLL
jgi:hypothetical protein